MSIGEYDILEKFSRPGFNKGYNLWSFTYFPHCAPTVSINAIQEKIRTLPEILGIQWQQENTKEGILHLQGWAHLAHGKLNKPLYDLFGEKTFNSKVLRMPAGNSIRYCLKKGGRLAVFYPCKTTTNYTCFNDHRNKTNGIDTITWTIFDEDNNIDAGWCQRRRNEYEEILRERERKLTAREDGSKMCIEIDF